MLSNDLHFDLTYISLIATSSGLDLDNMTFEDQRHLKGHDDLQNDLQPLQPGRYLCQ